MGNFVPYGRLFPTGQAQVFGFEKAVGLDLSESRYSICRPIIMHFMSPMPRELDFEYPATAVLRLPSTSASAGEGERLEML